MTKPGESGTSAAYRRGALPVAQNDDCGTQERLQQTTGAGDDRGWGVFRYDDTDLDDLVPLHLQQSRSGAACWKSVWNGAEGAKPRFNEVDPSRIRGPPPPLEHVSCPAKAGDPLCELHVKLEVCMENRPLFLR